MATGWEKVGDEWYYFHEDGGMNEGQLVLDNAVYEFEDSGALKTAKWLENTGGGAYNAGCYDDITQNFSVSWGMKRKNSILTHIQTENGNMTATTTPVMTGMQALLWI